VTLRISENGTDQKAGDSTRPGCGKKRKQRRAPARDGSLFRGAIKENWGRCIKPSEENSIKGERGGGSITNSHEQFHPSHNRRTGEASRNGANSRKFII